MNKEKLEECSKLLEDSMSVLQKDTELWKQFLQFATQFTYYRFRDQLLIYAQNQQATACATFAQWKRIGRYVRSGEHSIVLLDETGLKPKLRHVFDVMSTGPEKEFAYRPKPILSEEREELAKQLSAVYAKENSSYFTDAQQWEGDLEHTLSQIALYMTQQYYGVSLEQAAEQSENGEIPTYYVATATSAMYLLLSKYGFEKEANQLDFSCMEQLDEKQFENVGTAASAILSRTARMIRQIHPQIQRETQTEKQPERSHENEERIDNGGYSQENHISSGGELYGTGHWTAGGRGGRTGTEKVRNDEKEVSGGEQSVAVREHGDARNTVSRDEEGGRSSRPDPGTDASEAGKGSRSDSGIEANESAGVGSQNGSLQPSGRRSNSGGTGVQLTLSDYKEGRLTQLIFCDNSTPKAGIFNVYDDVKAKLLEAGIPKEEVAFIHDADTEIKKKELFSKVRNGQVRILLGSTQKMGAGTNVQDKLIAVHHLDVGWRPADMTQRNGRIIRQGNSNPVVQIYNYVTEGTFDAYLWQTLENKQKFISQIMTSKSPVRSCEDVDEQVLSYAEVKALCAGDDRIKEKMDLEVEVARLRMLKAEHQSTLYRLEDQLLKTFPEQIKRKEAILQSLSVDIDTAKQHPAFTEDTISIELFGKTYTDRKDAAKALLDAGKTCRTMETAHLGSYRGFELEGYVNIITSEIQISVKGELGHPFELSSIATLNLTRLDNVIQKMPEQMELEKSKLDALYQQKADAEKQLKEPFPQEDQLKEKTERLEELAAALDIDSHGKKESSHPDEDMKAKQENQRRTRSIPSRQSRFSRFRQEREEVEIEEEMEY